MVIVPHPEIVININGVVPRIRRQVGWYFGRYMQNRRPATDPIYIEVSVEPVRPKSGCRIIDDHAAFSESELFLRGPRGWELALRLTTSDSAFIRVDSEAATERWLYTTESVMRLLSVSRGLAFVHAAAVSGSGRGLLLPAWGGTGKTKIMLFLMRMGYNLVGDDLVPVTSSGRMFPYEKPINMMWYNFTGDHELRELLSQRDRVMLNAATKLDGLANSERLSASRIKDVVEIVTDRIKARLSRRVDPVRLRPEPYSESGVSVDMTAFMFKKSGEQLETRKGVPTQLAARMAACLRWEREHYGDDLSLLEYAFPELRSLIRSNLQAEERIIKEAFRESGVLLSVDVPTEFEAEEVVSILSSRLSS